MSQIIDNKLLKYLAELARLELSAKESSKFLKDFTKIIDHFKELEKVNTKNVEPIIGGADLKNVLRQDEVDLDRRSQSVDDAGHIIKAFPESERGYLKVPKTL